MQLDLYSPQQGHRAFTEAWQKVKPGLEAGKKYTLTIAEQSKTREQEKKYHAIIAEIAAQAQHLGSKWDSESWKRLLVQKFCKDVDIASNKIIPNLDGDGVIQLGFQTRRFTKDQASQFVEWLQAWAANNGVELSE